MLGVTPMDLSLVTGVLYCRGPVDRCNGYIVAPTSR